MFVKTVENMPGRRAFKYRNSNGQKQTITYIETYEMVNAFALGLSKLGLSKTHVSIFSENRIEWFVADMALLGIGSSDVPRGTDTTAFELRMIVEHSNSEAIIVENSATYEKIKDIAENMKAVIVLDDSIDDEKNNVYSYSSVMQMGIDVEKDYYKQQAEKVSGEDVATIIYTSGTTGKPKGVMLEHKNILHNVEVLPPLVNLNETDTLLSILPIWHIYERTICYVCVSKGAFTVYSNKRLLKNDLAEERPTILISVPAVWLNVYNGVMNKISKEKPLKRALARFLIEKSVAHIRNKRIKNDKLIIYGEDTAENHSAENPKVFLGEFIHFLAKKIVFKNIVALTGGRLRYTISGGGALPMHVEDFLEAAGVTLIVGWGITETSPVVSLRLVEDNIRGTCGKEVPQVEVEIRGKDGEKLQDGEMGVCWLKGPNIMRGYYKDPLMTSHAIVDGWYNSGDLGKRTKQGHIVLVGRAKETIVLLSGENIEPLTIEDAAMRSNFIDQIVLVGQDRKFLGALIYPNLDKLKEVLNKTEETPIKEILETDESRKIIRKELDKHINEENGFKQYERIIRFALIDEPFSTDNGLMTQSLKFKRNEIFERYGNVIDNLYN